VNSSTYSQKLNEINRQNKHLMKEQMPVFIKSGSDEKYKTELLGVTNSAAITAAGFIFLTLATFITNVLITRTLGASDYGLYVLATRVLEILILIAALGFTPTIIRQVSFFQAREEYKLVKGIVVYSAKVLLLFSFLVLAVSLAFSNLIAQSLFWRPELAVLIRILAVSVPFSVLATAFVSSLNGLKKIRHTVLISKFMLPSLFLVITAVVIVAGRGIEGIIWAHLAFAAASLLIAWFYLNRLFFSKYADVKPHVAKRELWNFSVPMYFNQFFNTAVRILPVFVMGYYLPDSEIGVFNVGFRLALLVSAALGAFHLIFAPLMAELYSVKDFSMISRLYKTITKWIFSASLLVFGAIILYYEPLLGIFGYEFRAGGLILLILAAGELSNASVGLAGNLLIMGGRPGLSLTNSILAFALVLTLCLILIPGSGATGAAIAAAISVAFVNMLRVVELKILDNIHPFKISFLKPLLASVAAAAGVFLFNKFILMNEFLQMATGMLMFGILFLLLNWLLKPDEEDLFILNRIGAAIKKRSK
jgi:O-antigen/teichoic acid export membrane protein